MEMRDPSSQEVQPQNTSGVEQPTTPVQDTDTVAKTQPLDTDAESHVIEPADDVTIVDDSAVAEPQNPEAEAEAEVTAAIEDKATHDERKPLTKEMVVAELEAMLALDAAEIQRERVTRMRQHYSNIRKAEVESAREEWSAAGNPPEAFVVEDDPVEAQVTTLITQIRDKKNAWAVEQEEQRNANLKIKNDIIDRINALAVDTDNVNRTFPEYRELQDRFNAAGPVPPTEETSVWKRFQEAREHYNDNLNINKELRDYDFKKNLDAKQALIAQARELDGEQDVITAFRRLQDLHDKWRQIGPVAKDLREDIWNEFKDASAVINKKYQAYFEERKARELANEEAKTAMCETIEALDFTSLSTFGAWDEMTARIIELQNQWKTIGYAPRKSNNALFARFRQRCDEFFAAKGTYFKSVKEEYAANLAKKTALAERAEALKDSTEWRKATDEFVAMQKEWKTIGAVPKRHSDVIWKRFLGACDYFFDKKKEATSGQREAEQANLKAKRDILDRLKSLAESAEADDAAETLRELRDQWQQIGHVPFRDKDKVNDQYRTLVNDIHRKFNIRAERARMDRFEANISQMDGDKQKLYRERDRLARALEGRKNDIRTYENNIGFLTSKSKSGESMVNEFRRKIDRLKEDIVSIQEKIRLIDEKMSDK